MTSWDAKSYWAKADDIAYSIYRQLFDNMEKRGRSLCSFVFNNDLSFELSSLESQICVDIVHVVKTSNDLLTHDNIAVCMADQDYSEIEIQTLLPKNSQVRSVKKDKKFQWDLLNVIRHELEHVMQGCNLTVNIPELIDYNRSNSNFLLDSSEVPAYVHGFRIATSTREHFLNTITQFIERHSKHLDLSKKETDETIQIWNNYLKNLKYYDRIKDVGEKYE